MHHPSELLMGLWVDYRASAFPEGCVGRDVDGINLLSLDTFASGCVAAYVRNGCRLDVARARMLRTSIEQLRLVTPQLDDEARVHFGKLLAVAQQVVREMFREQ